MIAGKWDRHQLGLTLYFEPWFAAFKVWSESRR